MVSTQTNPDYTKTAHLQVSTILFVWDYPRNLSYANIFCYILQDTKVEDFVSFRSTLGSFPLPSSTIDIRLLGANIKSITTASKAEKTMFNIADILLYVMPIIVICFCISNILHCSENLLRLIKSNNQAK